MIDSHTAGPHSLHRNAVSEDADANGNNSLQEQLQLVEVALARTSLEALKTAINRATEGKAKDDAQVCRMRNGELGARVPELVAMLQAAGLRVVPASMVHVDGDVLAALATLTERAMGIKGMATRIATTATHRSK